MDTQYDRPRTASQRLVEPALFSHGASTERSISDLPDAPSVTWRFVDSPGALADAVRSLGASSGPFAIDSERAGGYRYSQRAYLVQVSRAGTENFLVDPIACPDLHELAEVLSADEWILHAASQDLPCLADLGLRPPSLFDTELAGRLLGKQKVGLAAMLLEALDVHLAKQHSAADWSTRPLPESWLEYAALDVAYLADLRVVLSAELQSAGKSEWARQEFDHVLHAPAKPPRPEPWRRTSRITDARTRRALGVVRELWTVRDEIARELDKAPSKLVNDRALMAVASRDPLPQSLPTGRTFRIQRERWDEAYLRALSIPASQLPSRRGPSREGLPDPRNWKNLDPEAAQRLTRVKETIAALSEEHSVPAENLLSPAHQRLVAWHGADVATTLNGTDAREWQKQLVTAALQHAVSPHYSDESMS